jgi:DNA-binding NarL/FixJ family response regulator
VDERVTFSTMKRDVRIVLAGTKDLRRQATEALAGSRFLLSEVEGPKQAVARVRDERPDVVLVPGEAGATRIRAFRAASPKTKVITVHRLQRGASSVAAAKEADDFVLQPLRPAELSVRIERLVAQGAAESQASLRSTEAVPLVAELHDENSGRIDAKKLARYLGVPLAALTRAVGKGYKAAFKSPTSAGLHAALAPVHRAVVALHRLFGDRKKELVWLQSPHPDLDGTAPMELILSGKAEVVADMLEGALMGMPS